MCVDPFVCFGGGGAVPHRGGVRGSGGDCQGTLQVCVSVGVWVYILWGKETQASAMLFCGRCIQSSELSVSVCFLCCCCRVLRGVLAARAGRWLREAALSDSGGGATFNRMVTVMDQIMEAAAEL
jgi:hypothetical protein